MSNYTPSYTPSTDQICDWVSDGYAYTAPVSGDFEKGGDEVSEEWCEECQAYVSDEIDLEAPVITICLHEEEK